MTRDFPHGIADDQAENGIAARAAIRDMTHPSSDEAHDPREIAHGRH